MHAKNSGRRKQQGFAAAHPATPSQQGGRERGELMKPSATKIYMQTAALMQSFSLPHTTLFPIEFGLKIFSWFT
jgi:hypothetical protein